MKFLPYDQFVLVSQKSSSELADALKPEIGKQKFFRLVLGPFGSPFEHNYEGECDANGFKIVPAIRYQNSFLPVIIGSYEPHFSGIKILVRQRLNIFVMVFTGLWIAGVVGVGGLIFFLPDQSSNQDISDSGMFGLIPGMLAFVWVLATGAFWWEARHTKGELMRILDATEDMSV